MKKKFSIIGGVVIIIVVAALAIFFYNKNQQDNSVTKVRYAAPLTIAATPVYVATEKGFWNDVGLDVEVSYFNSGREALDALLSNNAEVMSVSETPPLRAFLKGNNISTITTVTEHREAKLTIRSDRISSADDIKGKKIGTAAGTNSDYYMYRWLESNGIDTSEVEIIQLDAPGMVQALVQGNIDAMFAWEPHNYNAYSKISDKATSWPTVEYEGRHTINMNTDYVASNLEIAEKIIRGFIKAENFIRENPEEAKEITRKITNMSEEVLDQLWDEYTYTVQLDDGFASILEDEAKWIIANDGLENTPNPLDMVNAGPLKNVDSKRVGSVFNKK